MMLDCHLLSPSPEQSRYSRITVIDPIREPGQTKEQGWKLINQRGNDIPTQRSSESSCSLYSLISSAVNTTDLSLILYSSTSQGVPFTFIYSVQLQ